MSQNSYTPSQKAIYALGLMLTFFVGLFALRYLRQNQPVTTCGWFYEHLTPYDYFTYYNKVKTTGGKKPLFNGTEWSCVYNNFQCLLDAMIKKAKEQNIDPHLEAVPDLDEMTKKVYLSKLFAGAMLTKAIKKAEKIKKGDGYGEWIEPGNVAMCIQAMDLPMQTDLGFYEETNKTGSYTKTFGGVRVTYTRITSKEAFDEKIKAHFSKEREGVYLPIIIDNGISSYVLTGATFYADARKNQYKIQDPHNWHNEPPEKFIQVWGREKLMEKPLMILFPSLDKNKGNAGRKSNKS